MARPKRLKYTGTMVPQYGPDGKTVVGEQPDRWFGGVPARDLDEGDLSILSDDEIKNIMGGPDPLYVDPDAGKKDEAPARSPESGSREKP